ncbi:hypothetical protein PISMIDRAFT_189853 [Pisolithus microcarpus 441]|uniref:Uncharacterized protein n=1 Tax=Pisolithus microcarpus 441 TaxID=765257 RepID=A0A0C9ZEW3_9AGAM|nr:hypothetical protein BKA83DRAFT_4341462 [Pisolithus microcarpus]KAI6027855.1 hypothetical protein BKA83DRAFT_189853 [Pisolithus microcarpus]KIK18488.1 hypothetical protein PISMIDRAFT_189853 [Pisolithus microcarpus 441]
MDYDRKSTVSSFYGARRSTDILNANPPSTDRRGQYAAPSARPRVDSASSFYADRQSRASHDLLNQHGQSAGYNASSFFDAGRQEPVKGGVDEEEVVEAEPQADSWDIYADFNNVGPRYSTAFGIGQRQAQDSSYHQIPSSTPAIAPKSETDVESTLTPVELVTVPALGPEWQRSELKSMTKSGKRELKGVERKAKWKAWNRGEIGLFGTKWFTKKFLVFFVFGLCVLIGITLAITIPRVPGITFSGSSPLTQVSGSFNDSIPIEFSRSPANFSFPAYANVQVDTTGNIIPLTFNSIDAQVWYSSTNMQVATGYFGKKTLPAKSFPVIQIPLNFSYVATNDTDPTWVAWYDACKNAATDPNGVQPGINFELILNMDIAGLPTSQSASAQAANAACPFQLPVNSQ